MICRLSVFDSPRCENQGAPVTDNPCDVSRRRLPGDCSTRSHRYRLHTWEQSVTGRHREVFGERSLRVEPALCLRSVSVLTTAFGGLTCHRGPCMLLNPHFIVNSNPLSPPLPL